MTTTTFTPDRQQYRALVADVAARAKAVLPEAVNGRVESAVKLVLAHDVTTLPDGSIEVGSSSDPMRQYRLEGHTCTCQDFAHGQAPAGWCQHRIAAGIDKRVRELLPSPPERVEAWAENDVEGPLPELEPPPAPAPLPEAPASVNVRVTTQGREVQWTLRDTDEARLAMRLEALLARYPQPQAPAPVHGNSHGPQASPPPASEEPRWCPKHGDKMTLNHKDGRQWHSHRLATGEYCKGK